MFIKFFLALSALVVLLLLVEKGLQAKRFLSTRKRNSQKRMECAHDEITFPDRDIVNSRTSMAICAKCGVEIGRINQGTKG